MPDDTAKKTSKDKSLGSDISEPFVLPVPPPPPTPRTTSATRSASSRSPEPALTASNPPSLPISSGFTVIGPSPVRDIAESKTSDDPAASSVASVSSNKEQAASSSLVVGLICTVVVLLVVISIQYNQASDHETPPVLSSSGSESELTAARNETKAARNEVAQGERKIRDLEEQLVASRDTAEGKVASLLDENRKLERRNSELSSETAQLKSQLQTATRPTRVSESPPPVQKPPVAQQDGQIYRVAGLRPGDTLNVRSGPGVNYPVVTGLQNGARVTVTGAAVMNGPDAWLPCSITLNGVDPATGYNRSWSQKCWINSYFVEKINN